MKFTRYTEEQFIEAIKTSISIAQALIKLGVKPTGGNYWTAKTYIKKLSLDTSHMKGKCWSKGTKVGPKRPLSDYLENKFYVQSHKLRLRLIAEKVLEAKCEKCNLTEWQEQPIPLELHHKNGNREDNSLANLQLLCPNCHSQTDNHRGKNKRK